MSKKHNRHEMPEFQGYAAALLCGALMMMLLLNGAPARAQTAWDHYQKALDHQKNGDIQGARTELEKAVQKDPDSPFFHSALGLVYFNLADCDKAVPELKKAIKIENKMLDAHTALGTCYIQMGMYDDALAEFNTALSLNPPDKADVATLYNNLGEIYSIKGDTAKAEENLNKAMSTDPALITSYINLGNLYTSLKRYEDAIALYKKAIQLAPDYSLAHNNLAFAYISLNQYQEAKQALEQALKLEPNNEYYKENLSYLDHLLAEPKKIESGVLAGQPEEITIPPQPDSVERIRRTTGEPGTPGETAVAEAPETAQPETKQPETKQPETKQPETTQPQPETKQPETKQPEVTQPEAAQPEVKQPETAQPEPIPAQPEIKTGPAPPQTYRFETAQAGFPGDPNTYYAGALYNLTAGKLNEAKRDIDRALALRPEEADYVFVRGMIAFRRGDIETAAADFNLAAQLDPTHAPAHNALGYIYDSLGQHSTAEKNYWSALDADPDDGCAAANLATSWVRGARCDQDTMDAFAKAAQNRCPNGEYLNNMALCAFIQGDYQKAHSLAYDAMRKSPDNPIIKRNFDMIVEKTGLPYELVRVTLPEEKEPFYRQGADPSQFPLKYMPSVHALDFHQVIVANWRPKTVLVIPYANPLGVRNYSPTPSEIYTDRIAASITGTGFFKVITPKDTTLYTYEELMSDGLLRRIVERNPADIVYVGRLDRTELNNTDIRVSYGLKKKQVLECSTSMKTTVLDGKTFESIYNGTMTGVADIPDKAHGEVSHKDMEVIKELVFDDYGFNVSTLLMDHYNLLEKSVDRKIVKTVPYEEKHYEQYH